MMILIAKDDATYGYGDDDNGTTKIVTAKKMTTCCWCVYFSLELPALQHGGDQPGALDQRCRGLRTLR